MTRKQPLTVSKPKILATKGQREKLVKEDFLFSPRDKSRGTAEGFYNLFPGLVTDSMSGLSRGTLSSLKFHASFSSFVKQQEQGGTTLQLEL